MELQVLGDDLFVDDLGLAHGVRGSAG
jgi:hypothetical protein